MNKNYIVIPKVPTDALLGEASERRTDSNRAQKIQTLKALSSEARPSVDLRRWVGEKKLLSSEVATESIAKSGAIELTLSPEAASRLSQELDVQVIEDIPLDNIPSLRTVSPTQAPTANLWHLERMGVQAARSAGRIGKGANITVAVLDSGVDAAHTDLRGRVLDGVSLNDTGEFVRGPSADSNGHGTSIAGLIAGGLTGVAPEAKILPIATTIAQRIMLSDLLVRWLPWLIQNPVDIVNISMGVPRNKISPNAIENLDSLFARLLSVDILPVVAIGNDGPGTCCVPGVISSVLSVGATNQQDRVWASSGSMAPAPDSPGGPAIVAPGVRVSSALAAGGYQPWSGSSHAAALVSGFAALLLEQDKELTGKELRAEVIDRARMLNNISPVRQGAGLVSL